MSELCAFGDIISPLQWNCPKCKFASMCTEWRKSFSRIKLLKSLQVFALSQTSCYVCEQGHNFFGFPFAICEGNKILVFPSFYFLLACLGTQSTSARTLVFVKWSFYFRSLPTSYQHQLSTRVTQKQILQKLRATVYRIIAVSFAQLQCYLRCSRLAWGSFHIYPVNPHALQLTVLLSPTSAGAAQAR